jgi:hypothetical protein
MHGNEKGDTQSSFASCFITSPRFSALKGHRFSRDFFSRPRRVYNDGIGKDKCIAFAHI